MAEQKEEEPESYWLNLCLLGPRKAGKTALATRFANQTFDNSYEETFAMQSYIREVTIMEGRVKCKITLWDCSGDFESRASLTSTVRTTDGIILVHDLTDDASFNELELWMTFVKQTRDSIAFGSCPMIVIGTHNDLMQSSLDEMSLKVRNETMHNKWELPLGCHFQVSCKEKNSEMDAFINLIEQCVDIKQESTRLSHQVLSDDDSRVDSIMRNHSKTLQMISQDAVNKSSLYIIAGCAVMLVCSVSGYIAYQLYHRANDSQSSNRKNKKREKF